MAKKNQPTILDEIYASFAEPGKHWIVRYGLDLNVSGCAFDPKETSYNLDFRISTQQTRFENVYFNCYMYDYNTDKEYPLGYVWFKANQGEINREMMMWMADIISKGNEITSRIFKEVTA